MPASRPLNCIFARSLQPRLISHCAFSLSQGLTRHNMPKRKRIEPQAEASRPGTPRRGRTMRARDKLQSQTDRRKSVPNPRAKSPLANGIASNKRDTLDRTVQELFEMEENFQRAVRMQRLAVETSDLSVKAEPPEAVQKLDNKRPSRALNDKPKKKQIPVEEAPDEDYETEETPEDGTEAKLEDAGANTASKRPPAVNSEILPLPWAGRLGYACLNTYLRNANPPVFSSRTCRLSSILEHRHPLQDPSQPEHPTKNRPDKDKPADEKRGQKYVQELGLANARDIVKMIRWNDKYGIKFMRLSSEMFPFASHKEHGYKLAPFASETLAAAGKVAAELGHRLTTHPGQFTQIGSPRQEVVTASVRDLEYHDEMLSLLKLPPQMDRDAVMILHMGGVYGDKEATLDRFRKNYAELSDGVKKRLVLENDDVSWSVHDLLPVCEELNIPMVLDYHHHNIIFDKSMREGTQDIMELYDRISETWKRKNITQKMHYSEPTNSAVTPRDRRKHSARVKTLPPCVPTMDLMIEAKDKEQAVFELMRTFKLPGWNLFNNVVPYEREDQNGKPTKKPAKKSRKSKNGGADEQEEDLDGSVPEKTVSAEDFGMGGPENRVYWPEGMEEWLRPKKKVVAKKTAKNEDDEL